MDKVSQTNVVEQTIEALPESKLTTGQKMFVKGMEVLPYFLAITSLRKFLRSPGVVSRFVRSLKPSRETFREFKTQAQEAMNALERAEASRLSQGSPPSPTFSQDIRKILDDPTSWKTIKRPLTYGTLKPFMYGALTSALTPQIDESSRQSDIPMNTAMNVVRSVAAGKAKTTPQGFAFWAGSLLPNIVRRLATRAGLWWGEPLPEETDSNETSGNLFPP